MGSGTPGAAMHMSGELFKDMVHVFYRGAGPVLTDLLAGQVQVSFPTMPASIEHIRAGRLRRGHLAEFGVKGAAGGWRRNRCRHGLSKY
jgi:tripartite-type tricarboxylate transporter receptor subunit TctC